MCDLGIHASSGLIAEHISQEVSYPFNMSGPITRTVYIIKNVLLISEIGSCVHVIRVYCLDV